MPKLIHASGWKLQSAGASREIAHWLKTCFLALRLTVGLKLNAVFHASSNTDWFRPQSGIPALWSDRPKADIDFRFLQCR